MEKIRLIVGGAQNEYMNESELQKVIDDLEAEVVRLNGLVDENKKYRDMWYKNYNDEVQKVVSMKGDLEMVRDFVNRLLK